MAETRTIKSNYPGLYKLVDADGRQCKDKRGQLKWMLRASVPSFSGRDGKAAYRRISHRFAGSVADAKEELRKLENEAHNGTDATMRNMTLEEFFEVWLKHRASDTQAKDGEQPKASIETVERNKKDMQLVLDRVGLMPIRNIDLRIVEETLADIQRNGRVIGDGCLSAGTMSKIHKSWKKVMTYAVTIRAIQFNPFDGVKAPKTPKTSRTALSTAQCMELCDYLDKAEDDALAELEAKEERIVKLREKPSYNDDRGHVRGITRLGDIIAIRVLFNTGMRRGEVMALQWDCIDLGAQPRIRVKQSLTRDSKIKPPKTEAGKRTIPIDADLALRLRRWKKVQEKYLHDVAGIDINGKLPVFCSSTGNFQGVNNFERFWRKFRTEAGFDGLLIHELRHTWATYMCRSGAPRADVKKLGGWDDSRTLDEIYSHALDEDCAGYRSIMSDVVRGARVEKRRDGFHAIKSA